MLISNLSYCEDIPDIHSIHGMALVQVEADAFATGDDTLTLTDAKTKARELGKRGASIAFGKGLAIAIGDTPEATVSLYGEGDKVIENTKTKYFPRRNAVVTRGVIIAIDLP